MTVAPFMSAPARSTRPLTLFRDSRAETAPTGRRVVTSSAGALALTPVPEPAPSFPFLGVWFSKPSVKTTNASKQGKEIT
jgi:hypothetical protein